MKKIIARIDTIDEVLGFGAKKGAMHLYTTNEKLQGNKFLLSKHETKEVINFGSCSYLGLEFDERLRQGAIEAIKNYGTQFSSSRAYISIRHYEELENLLYNLFGSNTIVAPTTTLGHIGAIPVLVSDKDAILLDHQVHNSVQTAVNIVKTRGVYTELIRHNRLDILEDRLKTLQDKYEKIWYMADGIYSMYGDATPIDQVFELMDKYPTLHYYVDDAHGMSCYGKHGRGYVLGKKPLHERMIVATSLNKAFASGGGALIFPDYELARKFRTTGGPLNFSGPMQPGSLGAAIACSKIHLSPEIYNMQEKLHENIKYTNIILKKYNLPLIAETDSPIFFIGVSLPKIGYSIINRMMDEGYYVNAGIFPAVSVNNTGVRFTVTRLHTFKQIESMVEALAFHHAEVLKEEDFTLEQIYKAFKMKAPLEQKLEQAINVTEKQSSLKVEHVKSIESVSKQEWNSLLGERGTYDWEGMKFLEETFVNNTEPENNWEFDYLLIRDSMGKPILATFLTTTIWKDDMLSSEGISSQVEAKRKATKDPYYLTSKMVCMGSLLTEGNHLYVDRNSPLWKDAMSVLFEKITGLVELYSASGSVLRDFMQGDEEIDGLFMDNGYFKIGMPETHHVEPLNWINNEEFLERLSARSRRHIRQEVFKHEYKYEVEIIKNPTNEQIEDGYLLYKNVKDKSVLLNTFTLPYKLFKNIGSNANWEVINLKLKPEFDSRESRKPVASVFCYCTDEKYNPMIVGIDYQFNNEHNCYRQAIFQVLERARKLGKKTVNLGLSASIEKRKYGARPTQIVAYMQAKDNYALEVVSAMNVMQKSNI